MNEKLISGPDFILPSMSCGPRGGGEGGQTCPPSARLRPKGWASLPPNPLPYIKMR